MATAITTTMTRAPRARASAGPAGAIRTSRRCPNSSVACVARLARSMLTAKMPTASGLPPYWPRRLLVNGMAVMVNKNAKFHRARPRWWPTTWRKTRWRASQNWVTTQNAIRQLISWSASLASRAARSAAEAGWATWAAAGHLQLDDQ